MITSATSIKFCNFSLDMFWRTTSLNFKTVENIAKEKIKLAQKLEADGVAVLNENNKYLKEYAKHIYFDKVWYDGNSFDSAKNAAKAVGKIMNLQPKEIDEILKIVNFQTVK